MTPPVDPLDALCDAMLSLDSRDQLRALMRDLCTPAELEALADRWRVVPLLLDGLPYREIHDQTAVSVTTIGRVARCLVAGEGGYRLTAERLGLPGLDALHPGSH
jgi:TrpR-related protein YerC/YecD